MLCTTKPLLPGSGRPGGLNGHFVLWHSFPNHMMTTEERTACPGVRQSVNSRQETASLKPKVTECLTFPWAPAPWARNTLTGRQLAQFLNGSHCSTLSKSAFLKCPTSASGFTVPLLCRHEGSSLLYIPALLSEQIPMCLPASIFSVASLSKKCTHFPPLEADETKTYSIEHYWFIWSSGSLAKIFKLYVALPKPILLEKSLKHNLVTDVITAL